MCSDSSQHMRMNKVVQEALVMKSHGTATKTKGCKSHLSVKAFGEGNLPSENVAKSTFIILNSFSSSKYRSKLLLISTKIS